jgi:hypothetical protein
MPADPSIYGAIRPYQAPADPLQQYGAMMQLRAMGDASVMNDLHRRKLEGDLAEEDAFKSKIASWVNAGGTGQLPVEAYAASPARAAAFDKTRLEGEKTRGEIDRTKLEIHGKQVQQLRDSLAAANDDAALARVRDEATRLYGPSAAANMPASVSAPGFVEWKKSQIMTADKLIPPRQQDVAEIRKEFNALPEVKAYRDIIPVVEAARSAPDTRAGDMQLAYAVGKVLDPNSVVREGEFKMAQDVPRRRREVLGEVEVGRERHRPHARRRRAPAREDARQRGERSARAPTSRRSRPTRASPRRTASRSTR